MECSCGNKEFYTQVKGTQTGLYCTKCGKWIKWLSKQEKGLYEYISASPGTSVSDIRTNYDHIISSMTVERLAELMVTTCVEDNGDYAFDGEEEYWVERYETLFITPMGERYSDLEDAIQETIKWLQQDFIE